MEKERGRLIMYYYGNKLNRAVFENGLSTKQKSIVDMDKKNLKAWKKGALVGGLVGVLGTVITHLSGDISLISIPVVLLFSTFGAGLLFLSPYFELLSLVAVYGLIGAIIGYLIGGAK